MAQVEGLCDMIYDLAVAYRIYPKISGKPAFNFPSKYELLEVNLKSFVQAVAGMRIKVCAILDGCPEEMKNLVCSYLEPFDLELRREQRLGNGGSFKAQLEWLCEQQHSSFCYFAEDDYLYMPRALTICQNFLAAYSDVHFINPMDDLNTYRKHLESKEWERRATAANDRIWRSVLGCTLSFMTKKSVLANEMAHDKYLKGCSDLGVWMALTKRGLFSPREWFKDGRYIAGSAVLAWFHCSEQILSGPRFKLWAPRPGLSTHMEAATLSPSQDWTQRLKEL
jgi:hypothetical protein